ncbi:hypothetical protein QTG94_14450 [Clostridium perfringens]|uniref:hypothetical protein n=1 Tax=Clostridium perfringens TaxID=1502 RepID=UPI0013E2D23A|nr:hypothetical protein [Clostridium perfringens]MBI6048839.1 hypothetical protein [Clostridium perfringens]MCR1963964.1 hypothetical protein [Clostridium perfringens]MCX0416292.1 hypothetical protein [Clostridium perfringens]MDJ8927743.1 hypothetical protein [Clostridium perfringens]MDJ8936425.1 hypothetical protein [Clostridium perfringens]
MKEFITIDNVKYLVCTKNDYNNSYLTCKIEIKIFKNENEMYSEFIYEKSLAKKRFNKIFAMLKNGEFVVYQNKIKFIEELEDKIEELEDLNDNLYETIGNLKNIIKRRARY